MSVLQGMARDLAGRYRAICSIAEIEQQPILQWMFGASLFYFFVNFFDWIQRSNVTATTAEQGRAVCWPFIEHCERLHLLDGLPQGYSQSTVYMLWYGVMAWIVYLMWKKQWVRAHMLLLAMFVWKVFIVLISYSTAGPYDYYHIVLTAVLLFAAHKEYFLKLSFVFMYFMSATIKFSPAWVLGTYFSTLEAGLPLIPRPLIIVATNIVIFGQIVEGWFLLSKHRLLQRIALWYATFFHLYSGIFVYYTYPSVALPPILILFGPLYRYTPAPFTRKAIIGWTIIVVIGLCQLLGFLVSPNRFLTLEGHRYGMFMFEANHQCRYTVETRVYGTQPESSDDSIRCTGLYCTTENSVRTENGETVFTRSGESAGSWNRCDPYEVWARSRSYCDEPGVVRIAMRFDHSINGGPFYRIVDEQSICDLEYKAFSHNAWIKLPPEAPVMGYPLRNAYHYY